MRSGIANYSGNSELSDLLSADPSRNPPTSELLALAYPLSPEFAPGTEYEYSNTNTLILGEAIEQITGMPWFEAVDERILGPLELSSVTNGFTGESEDATGYQLADGEVVEALPPIAPNWLGAAGSLTGNIHDLAAWGRALGDGRLLSTEMQAERLSQFGSIADHAQSPEYDQYGFAMGEIAGWVGHTGNGLGFQALTMYDARSGVVIAILLNGTGEDPDLPAHVFREILTVMPAPAPAP